jgi:hypothetical protein
VRNILEREGHAVERTLEKTRLDLGLGPVEEGRAETIQARLQGFDAGPNRIEKLPGSHLAPGD